MGEEADEEAGEGRGAGDGPKFRKMAKFAYLPKPLHTLNHPDMTPSFLSLSVVLHRWAANRRAYLGMLRARSAAAKVTEDDQWGPNYEED